MKYKRKQHLASLLVLPLLLSACGGSSSIGNTAAIEAPSQASVEQSNQKKQSTDNGQSTSVDTESQAAEPKSEDTTPSANVITSSDANSSNGQSTPVDTESQAIEAKSEDKTPSVNVITSSDVNSSPAESDPLEKTLITEDLREKVKEAKTARDNAGLPHDYAAVYTFKSDDGKTRELRLRAPDDSEENYFFNSTIFPQGESQGKVKTSLGGQPHTEETFKSYQQFYTGIEGTQKHVVYFGDTPIKRDEPFFVELPTGLLTAESGVPTDKEATYNGKAISAAGFGDFTYTVDFANKVGKGGSIKWQQPGNAGDIALAGGKIGKQILSVYEHPEMLPETHSHRGQGITGKATVSGSESAYEYTALFFGPKAEEISGFVSEKHNDGDSGNQLVGHDDSQNIASFAGAR